MHVLLLQILISIWTNACTGSTDTYIYILTNACTDSMDTNKYMVQCMYWFYSFLCIYGPMHVLVLQILI